MPSIFRSKRDFHNEKRDAITIAKELMYGPEVIEKLKKATTSEELTRILATARKSRL